MAIFAVPFENLLLRQTAPSREGFALNTIEYSSKVTQEAFAASTQASARVEKWTLRWQVVFATPADVIAGATNELQVLLDFYKNVHLNQIRWKPFEYENTIIWRIIPSSLKRSNRAGCIFDVSMDIEFLYEE